MCTPVLIVKKFGPIKEVEISFNRFTFFVGSQGSGKSTVAKLYSMFLWLEKRLLRGMEEIRTVEEGNRFVNTYCGYHRLSSYFYPDTEIEFQGSNYKFRYINSRLEIVPQSKENIGEVVKVMYVPAERSFLSSLKNLSGLSSLPRSLQTFRDEYENANDYFYKGFDLPINHIRFEYDPLNKISWLIGDDYRVRLSDASSGFQAVLPMLLVSEYLSVLVSSRHQDGDGRLSMQEREKLNKEVRKVIENRTLSPEVREAALSALSARFEYKGFVNIVEEPEENLYPDSQREVLNKLLEYSLKEKGNQLVITTHSPYLIDYLTLAIKGREVLKKGGKKNEIARIVPLESCVSGAQVSIYEMREGYAERLPMPDGMPSDNNYLNVALRETNAMFDELLDIEDAIY